tara:strand:- start:20955 stop:21362 length:408 start_codon:yes stop_codon:yes gene_type:complete
MNRKALIYIKEVSTEDDTFENIHMSDIGNMISNSYDVIQLNDINLVQMNQAESIIATILDKLKPMGYLSIFLLDIHTICKDVSAKKLDDHKMSEILVSSNCCISLPYMHNLLENKNKKIINIENSEAYKISVTIQ